LIKNLTREKVLLPNLATVGKVA